MNYLQISYQKADHNVGSHRERWRSSSAGLGCHNLHFQSSKIYSPFCRQWLWKRFRTFRIQCKLVVQARGIEVGWRCGKREKELDRFVLYQRFPVSEVCNIRSGGSLQAINAFGAVLSISFFINQGSSILCAFCRKITTMILDLILLRLRIW